MPAISSNIARSAIEAVAPRVDDLSHLAAAIDSSAISLGRDVVKPAMVTETARVLKDGLRRIDDIHEALMVGAREIDTAGSASEGTLSAVRSARTALQEAQPLVAGTRPMRSMLHPFGVARPTAEVRSSLATASEAVAQAELAAQQLNGAQRWAMRPGAATEAIDITGGIGVRGERALAIDPTRVQDTVKPISARIAKAWKGAVEIEGLEHMPKRGAIVMPTHAGMVDGPVWLAPLKVGDKPLRPMMVKGNGPLGRINDKVMERFGVFTVDIGTGNDHALATAKSLLDRGHNVVVYGEGRLVAGDHIGMLRDGVARLALDTGAPVVPVATYGTKSPGAAASAGRGVKMIVGEPITFDGAVASPHNIAVARDTLQRSLMGHWADARTGWIEMNAAGRAPSATPTKLAAGGVAAAGVGATAIALKN